MVPQMFEEILRHLVKIDALTVIFGTRVPRLSAALAVPFTQKGTLVAVVVATCVPTPLAFVVVAATLRILIALATLVIATAAPGGLAALIAAGALIIPTTGTTVRAALAALVVAIRIWV